MNVYDKAHELAEALKECPEVIELKAASKKIEANETDKKMLKDFRKIQLEAYTEQVKNGKMSKEITEKLQNLGSVISLNPNVSAYLQSESKFGTIWEDIGKILNDAVDIKLETGLDK